MMLMRGPARRTLLRAGSSTGPSARLGEAPAKKWASAITCTRAIMPRHGRPSHLEHSSTSTSMPSSLSQPLIFTLQSAHFSSASPSAIAPTTNTVTSDSITATTTDMTEAMFDRIADEMLERLCEDLEELEPTAGEDFEIDYAMGVLTLVLDEHNTYVLNKQRPNRQVWLSSPISGPRRFELSARNSVENDDDKSVAGDWCDIRNNESLTGVLECELHEMTGMDLSLLLE